MNIIPEEPEQYHEAPRPTPGLSSLLTSKQFKFYTTANTSRLFGCISQTYRKKILEDIQKERKDLSRKIQKGFEINKKSWFFLGIGFGIIAITKVVKKLSNNS
jgi:hypothetical protein